MYKAPKKSVLQEIFIKGELPQDAFDYLMITYSQLKDAKRDMTRLNFLMALCEQHRVLFIFDEAHKSSGVNAGKASVITQGINMILEETATDASVFLSATFAKRPECLLTFMRRTTLSALATENTLKDALALWWCAHARIRFVLFGCRRTNDQARALWRGFAYSCLYIF